jgi:hypothetical protein
MLMGRCELTESRVLEILIGVGDDGSPDGYDKILRALASIGAEIIEETEFYE